jgi:hypothetical protein
MVAANGGDGCRGDGNSCSDNCGAKRARARARRARQGKRALLARARRGVVAAHNGRGGGGSGGSGGGGGGRMVVGDTAGVGEKHAGVIQNIIRDKFGFIRAPWVRKSSTSTSSYRHRPPSIKIPYTYLSSWQGIAVL